MKRALPLLLFCLLWSVATLAAATELTLGDFSGGELGDWQAKSFQGTTHCRLVTQDGRQVMAADSKGSGSGLVREMRVNLEKLPYLNGYS